MFARTTKSSSRLGVAFAARDVLKVYWGLLPAATALPAEHGRVRQWLRKDKGRNTVRQVSKGAKGAKEAVTDWRVLYRGRTALMVEFKPLTGRSHQLRVAIAVAIGSPRSCWGTCGTAQRPHCLTKASGCTPAPSRCPIRRARSDCGCLLLPHRNWLARGAGRCAEPREGRAPRSPGGGIRGILPRDQARAVALLDVAACVGTAQCTVPPRRF